MAKHDLPTYRPSGGLSPLVFVFALGALVAGGLLAFVYQGLLNWIPIIQLKFLATFGFGGALLGSLSWLTHAGHCRNRPVAYLLALVIGAGALYASYWWDWRWQTANIAKDEAIAVEQVREELPLGQYLTLKKKSGWKMKRGGSVTGGMVTFLWGIEALLVLGMAVWGAHLGAGSPYCEKCGAFCREEGYNVWGVGEGSVAPLFARRDLTAVALVTPEGEGIANTSLNLTLATCPKCPQTGFLTVKEKTVVAKKGKQQETERTLVAHAVLRPEERQAAEERLRAITGQKLS
jgi:hypothetical protein